MQQSEWVTLAHGSFGSRNGQPWTRELALANARSLPSDTGAGTHGSVVGPSETAILAAIESQTCPWCGAGPYKMLAGHTNKAHGVDRQELRRLAGLDSRSSICAPERSEDARKHLTSRNMDGSLSKKGGQAAAERGIHFLGSQTRVAKLASANRLRDAAILSDYHAGLGREEIARRNATGTAVVARVLAAAGIKENGRRRAALKRDTSDMLKASIAATQRLSKEKVARYAELGSNWAAIHQLSAEYAVSAKSFAALMRKHGAHVPDGRK